MAKKPKKKKKKVAQKKKPAQKKPSASERAMRQANKLFKQFHWGQKIEKFEEKKLPDHDILINLADVFSISYVRKEDPKTIYVHEFKKRPQLMTNLPGNMLLIVGGKIKITERGIEG